MNSYDIFDTLIGRWYYYPDTIFAEVEKETQLANFVWMRKHAENIAKEKTLAGIYLELQKLACISDDARELVKSIEFDLECRRTFPIMENMFKVKTDDVLISDTYLNKQQLEILLDVNGLPRGYYKDIICSYDGKSSGKVWDTIRPSHHLGDNYESDFISPSKKGIRAEWYVGNLRTDMENFLIGLGWSGLANLSRATRLLSSETYPDGNLLWKQQAEINIPLLILTSIYLRNYSAKYDRILFTQRDCVLLDAMFKQLFPEVDSRKFYTSRVLYENPTPEFTEYVKRTYTPNSLIVDLQGTGKTCASFFNSIGLSTPNYFSVVCSDLDPIFNFPHIVHRRDGFTDKIERLNYDNAGKTISIDLALDYPIRENFVKSDYIESQHRAFREALRLLRSGFKVETEMSNSIPDAIRVLLRELEIDCEICKHVNHEAM